MKNMMVKIMSIMMDAAEYERMRQTFLALLFHSGHRLLKFVYPNLVMVKEWDLRNDMTST
jgi:hypothetical protein